MQNQPAVSVTVVSDYLGGEQKSWDDLEATLTALSHQDFDEPIDFILLEHEAHLADMPAHLPKLLPGLRVVGCDLSGSYEMKNVGTKVAAADLIMQLDADCIPNPGWVRSGVAAMRAHPEAAAVSGRTHYPGDSRLEKALALLSRSFVDAGDAAEIGLLSTNNMIARRSALEAVALPEGAGPFAYRIQSDAWQRLGYTLRFEPGMHVVHDFEGWDMERDLRRQIGWTSIRIRQLDSQIVGAGIVKSLGIFSLPLFYAYRIAESVGRSFRLTKHFGLELKHVPYLIGLATRVHALELPGMRAALAGQDSGDSAYR